MYKKYLPFIVAIFCGGLLTTAFSPINFSLSAFIALLGFFYLLSKHTRLRTQLIYGFLFGLGFFSTSVSWIYISIYAFSESNILGFGLTGIFILVLSLFPVAFVLLCYCFTTKSPLYKILLYPVFWVVVELLRTFLFTGFPWVLLGYSQTNNFLASYASIGSVFLVSFIVCFIAILLTQTLLHYRKIKLITIYFIAIILCLTSGLWLSKIPFTAPQGNKKTVSIIQGNYIQDQKWDQAMLETIMRYYYTTTQQQKAELIFWPENAIPTFKPLIAGFLRKIDLLAKQQNTAVLVGTVDVNGYNQYFNSAFVYGNGAGHYYKHHLVPFGEYYPFSFLIEPFMHYFNIPMSSFTKGNEIQPLLEMSGIKIAMFICYESAYPFELRQQLQNAELIVVTSDDAWFGDSLAPWQHEEIAQMRAIETGRFVVQATNNGVTSIINQHGHIIARLPYNQQSVLTGVVQPMKGQTLWLKYGLLPLCLLTLLFIITALIFALVHVCKGRKSELHLNA